MTGPSLRTALHSTLAALDAQIKTVEAHHAALLSIRKGIEAQLHMPRATRQCACGGAITRERELAGDTRCQRCEVMATAKRSNSPVPRCQAMQYSDQMSCGRCVLTWDVNDPDPPCCPVLSKVQSIKSKEK